MSQKCLIAHIKRLKSNVLTDHRNIYKKCRVCMK
nr:MAG TPA: hypothetical protein [Bacteriophage sp.]